MKTNSTVFLATIIFCGLISNGSAITPSFQGLGGFLSESDKNSGAYAVSDDGSTIVGASSYGGCSIAILWRNNTVQVLGDNQSKALGVSADGSIVTGDYLEDHAVYWKNGNMTILDDVGINPSARGVSSDGSIIIGESGGKAVVWKNGVLSMLDNLPGGNSFGSALAVSSDGMKVVGDSAIHAVYWDTDDGSVHELGYVSEGNLNNIAQNISPNGNYIVGYEGYSHYQEAFLWQSGQMIGLGRLDGYSNRSIAYAVSNNEIVVGMAEIDNHENAFIWDQLSGIRELKNVLINDYALDLTGWQLLKAYDISADGKVIVGSGINPDGIQEAWVATIPEPASLLLLTLGGLMAIRKK
jgi:probable HAF family extracellular repeat protein